MPVAINFDWVARETSAEEQIQSIRDEPKAIIEGVFPMKTVALVPCYRASKTVVNVVSKLERYVDQVVVIDDACPENSGDLVAQQFIDRPNVEVVARKENGGVGAAVKSGLDWALSKDFQVIVKVDADDQMDVSYIPEMVDLIRSGKADFVKGNRFQSVSHLEGMPALRVIGNSALSLFSKISTGLWSVNDPTNGFFAISVVAARLVQHNKLHDRFFFESDLLFRVGLADCRVKEVAMPSIYGDEKSNLQVSRVILTFPFLHFRNLVKRIAYTYFVREWSLGTLNLLGSSIMFFFAVLIGVDALRISSVSGNPVTAGQAVGVSLTAILGFQLFLSFLSYDVQMERKQG